MAKGYPSATKNRAPIKRTEPSVAQALFAPIPVEVAS
jgi:hypothetical protein